LNVTVTFVGADCDMMRVAEVDLHVAASNGSAGNIFVGFQGHDDSSDLAVYLAG
jgi:hypothetical protein